MWFPLLNHSHYSLLLSCQSPEDIVQKCVENGYTACGLTDFTSISGCVKFYKACKKAKIKPILGCEINTEYGTITLLCRNLQGWKELLNIVSISNDKDHHKEYPTIPLEELKKLITVNLRVIDGYYGSVFCNQLFTSEDAYLETDHNSLKEKYLRPDWKEFTDQYFQSASDPIIFDADSNTVPINKVLSECLSPLGAFCGNQTYYLERDNAADQRVLVATKLKTTFRKLDAQIKHKKWLNKFLNSSSYYIPTAQEAEDLGLDGTLLSELSDDIEDFDILSPPKFPHFCDNEDEYLTELCRKGWRDRLIGTDKIATPEKKQEYVNRIKMELGVIKDANLAGYFLTVQDFINHFRMKGQLIDIRGSAGGCLISYLIGISNVDPIEYGLMFSRFYNSSRKGSLPDIDTDFPPDVREEVIEYIRNKYGEKNVCQICTFGRLQGRSALKEVLRVNEYCTPTEMDIITDKLPSEAAISDLLEEMEEKSVIRWTLENDPDELKDYCWIENGKLYGQYAKAFEQAMRIEGSLKTQGKHAAGIVIATEAISNFAPMVKGSRSSELLAGFEMKDLEAVGGIKYDVLGVNVYSKLRDTCREWDE